ncbi:MAG: hypothetical protein WCP18_02235 [bacterium]
MAYKRTTRFQSDDPMMENEDQPYRQSRGGQGTMIIVAILVVIVVLAGGWFLMSKFTSVNLPGSSLVSGGSDWQAIFLTNGQVYFGKVKGMNDKTVILADIYYLQVVNKPLQSTQEGTAATNQQQELTLIKLGNELHGPVDEMNINRDQVLLTEKLKKDSRVVQAINNYVTQQKNGTTEGQPGTVPAGTVQQ